MPKNENNHPYVNIIRFTTGNGRNQKNIVKSVQNYELQGTSILQSITYQIWLTSTK